MAHPLDPLTAEEITEAVTIVRRSRQLPASIRFPVIALEEPVKGAATDPADRRVFLVCFDLADKTTAEALVSLQDGKVASWRPRPGVQPAILPEEARRVDAALRADGSYREALARRGLSDVDQVAIESGPAGRFGAAWEDRLRIVRSLAFHCVPGEHNYYAHPIDGLLAYVDTSTYEVLEVVDEALLPVPREPGHFAAGSTGPARTDVKPVEVVQPEGPSFTVTGQQIRWQKWRLRFSLHPVEGLVLHEVGYEDAGRVRPILHRAGLTEMVVPYGDTALGQYWRNSFDAGEAGIGKKVVSLSRGCDCLGEIRYFDAVLSDDAGEPYSIRNAVCLHEEDVGILWKHVDEAAGVDEVRRSRRLVLSCIAAIGNYDYGFYWYLYQDGTIQHEVKLTGIIFTGAAADGTAPAYGELVAPNLYAPNHQHIFNYRLDMEVDGPRNSVAEVDVERVPRGEGNPHGIAFRARTTVLGSEAEAQRLADPAVARYWKVVNPHSLNRLGNPVAYKLVPAYGAVMLADDSSMVANWAGFARKHLWVTPYHPDERYAAGRYPAWGDRGLQDWVAADRPVADTDIVVWHTFTATHVVRPEDWPIMPVETTGFTLKPVGFFDRNPALDVPPTRGHCHG